MQDDGPLLTVYEVAERLRVNPYTVRRWLRDGRLRGARLGKSWKVRPAEVRRVEAEGLDPPRESGGSP